MGRERGRAGDSQTELGRTIQPHTPITIVQGSGHKQSFSITTTTEAHVQLSNDHAERATEITNTQRIHYVATYQAGSYKISKVHYEYVRQNEDSL